MLWQSGWFWIVIGFAMGTAETLLPGFILLGFGLGAVLTGLLLFLGVVGQSLPVVLLVWAVASALGWVILKAVFTRHQARPKIWKKDINDN
ncbi:NfeD family protein [Frigidibacter sp. ROC022]|uniref:NfeD family protein n=1 Tax=Frigidibacter sp. ROC022 TaxID=2971796 RepID=UPI00215B1B25|nr:hypothetical protein [Frigidibacter sp. ROC022]MCR8724247.1 hypothetical protein [Frigidibacter sp. ROC022]